MQFKSLVVLGRYMVHVAYFFHYRLTFFGELII